MWRNAMMITFTGDRNVPIYVDTSGFYAYACADDGLHKQVKEVFKKLAAEQERIITSSYVLCEVMGLMLKRLGFSVLKDFVDDVLPIVDIIWIGEEEHAAGWQLMQSKPKRKLTIVDATGIAVMRKERLRKCVALDAEFVREGFEVLPKIAP